MTDSVNLQHRGCRARECGFKRSQPPMYHIEVKLRPLSWQYQTQIDHIIILQSSKRMHMAPPFCLVIVNSG